MSAGETSNPKGAPSSPYGAGQGWSYAGQFYPTLEAALDASTAELHAGGDPLLIGPDGVRYRRRPPWDPRCHGYLGPNWRRRWSARARGRDIESEGVPRTADGSTP